MRNTSTQNTSCRRQRLGVEVVGKGGLADCQGYQSCPGRDQGGRLWVYMCDREKGKKETKPKKSCVSLFTLLIALLMTN